MEEIIFGEFELLFDNGKFQTFSINDNFYTENRIKYNRLKTEGWTEIEPIIINRYTKDNVISKTAIIRYSLILRLEPPTIT